MSAYGGRFSISDGALLVDVQKADTWKYFTSSSLTNHIRPTRGHFPRSVNSMTLLDKFVTANIFYLNILRPDYDKNMW